MKALHTVLLGAALAAATAASQAQTSPSGVVDQREDHQEQRIG